MSLTTKIDCPGTGSGTAKKSHLIQFLEPPTAANTINEVIDKDDLTTWNVFHREYATAETGAGREVWKVRQQHPEVTAFFDVDYNSKSKNVLTRHAVLANDQYFHIVSIENINLANQTLRIYCRGDDDR